MAWWRDKIWRNDVTNLVVFVYDGVICTICSLDCKWSVISCRPEYVFTCLSLEALICEVKHLAILFLTNWNFCKNKRNRKTEVPRTEKPHEIYAKTANRKSLSKPKKRTKNREKPKNRMKNREKPKNRAEKGRKPQNRKQVDPPLWARMWAEDKYSRA
jgi:hypothetical protein